MMIMKSDIDTKAIPSQDVEEVLTREEMELRFPSEWILVVDPEIDRHQRVIRGTVLHHSKDREEIHRKAIELRPSFFSTLFTGAIPGGTEFVL